MLIDVHCHIDKLIEEGVSVENCIKNALKNDVKLMVVNGTNPNQNAIILELAKKHREIKVALGIYPLDALKLSQDEIDKEIELIIKNKDFIVAIGEVGLDLKEEELHKTLDKQKANLTKFVNLAISLKKPVIIHSRKAELHTIELLEQLNAKKVIMHCFSGGMELVKRIAGNGWFLSIPSSVKYNEHFQKIVEIVSLENLFCETDSPYLHPNKEKDNEPANVIDGYKKIAEIKCLSLKEIADKVWENWERLIYS